MNCAERALEPRQLRRAARRSARPRACRRGRNPSARAPRRARNAPSPGSRGSGGVPWLRTSDVGVLVRAVRHVVGRKVRQRRDLVLDDALQLGRLLLGLGLLLLVVGDLREAAARCPRRAISRRRSPWRLRLRRAWISWAVVSAARHLPSSAISSAARGGRPRRARPRSNSAGLSRIHFKSNMSLPIREGWRVGYKARPRARPSTAACRRQEPAASVLPRPRAWPASSRPCGTEMIEIS